MIRLKLYANSVKDALSVFFAPANLSTLHATRGG